MIVRDIIAFGALYSTKGEFRAESEFAFFVMSLLMIIFVAYEADRNEY